MKKLLLLLLLFFLFCSTPNPNELPTINAIWEQHDVKGTQPEERSFCGFAYNDDGNDKAFVFGGGKNGIFNLESTWEYNVVNKTWLEYNTDGTRPSYRYAPNMIYVGNNKIILFGGMHDENDQVQLLDDIWEYDTINHIWTEIEITGNKPIKRVYCSMVYVGNNKCIMFGGYNDMNVFFNDTWEFDTENYKWTEMEILGDKPSKRKDHKMAYLGNGKIVMYGGWMEDVAIPCGTWIYEVGNKVWREIDEERMPSMLYHSMAYIGNNEAITFGGNSNGVGFTNNVHLFDGNEEKWYKVKVIGDAIPEGRIEPAMTYNGNDGAFMFGGSIDCGEYCLALNDVWEFSLADEK